MEISSDALLRLGEERYRLGYLEGAMESLSHAIELEPCNAEAHRILGIALLDAGQREKARDYAAEALRLSPTPSKYYTLAWICKNSGETDRARELFEQILALEDILDPMYDTERGEALKELGEHYFNAGEYQLAIDYLGEAIEAFPNNSDLFQKFSECNQKLSPTEGIDLKEGYAEGIQEMCVDAAVLFDEGKLDDALAAFEVIHSLNPRLPDANRNLALLHYEKGKLAMARYYCEREIELHPDNIGAYNALGAILMELGDTERGIDAFKRALGMEAQDERGKEEKDIACANLGNAYFMVGDYSKAEERLKDAILVFPADEDISALLIEIQEMKRKGASHFLKGGME